MGLFDRIKQSAKDVTGLGLSGQEQYARAYSKGVFLQPPNYRSASKNFFEAQEKFEEEGNKAMALRAHANGVLYDFYSDRDVTSIDRIIDILSRLEEIERIGSQNETVRTDVLVKELSGFQAEAEASKTADHREKAVRFKEAGDHYLSLGKTRFTFLEAFKVEGPVDSGISRGYYSLAMSDYHMAMSHLRDDPDDAQDLLHRSLTGFRRSDDKGWASNVEGYLERLKKKRHCWMCSREVQGEDIYYKHYPSDLAPYYSKVLDRHEHDKGMLDLEGHVTVCTACGSMIEKQADHYASMRALEVRRWAEPIMDRHSGEIASLWSAVRSLESRIAFHNH